MMTKSQFEVFGRFSVIFAKKRLLATDTNRRFMMRFVFNSSFPSPFAINH